MIDIPLMMNSPLAVYTSYQTILSILRHDLLQQHYVVECYASLLLIRVDLSGLTTMSTA